MHYESLLELARYRSEDLRAEAKRDYIARSLRRATRPRRAHGAPQLAALLRALAARIEPRPAVPEPHARLA